MPRNKIEKKKLQEALKIKQIVIKIIMVKIDRNRN
jgi:hypothetical protein